MEDTQGEVTTEVAENTEPTTAEVAENVEVYPVDTTPAGPVATELTEEEKAAAAVLLAAAALVVAEETFVALEGHEIQHTAHLTDGPPWN